MRKCTFCDVDMDTSASGDVVIYTCPCCHHEEEQPTLEFGMRIVGEEEIFGDVH